MKSTPKPTAKPKTDLEAWARAEKEWLDKLIATLGEERAAQFILKEIDADSWCAVDCGPVN